MNEIINQIDQLLPLITLVILYIVTRRLRVVIKEVKKLKTDNESNELFYKNWLENYSKNHTTKPLV